MLRIAVGVVAKPHGVRGDLKVRVYNPGSAVLVDADTVWLAEVAHRVLMARAHGDFVVLRLDGVDGREAAQALRGREVSVPRDAVEVAEDEYLLADLVGCAAFDQDDQALGVVVEVMTAGQDRLVIHDADSERIVPALPEFVLRVDTAARKVWLELPDGLPCEPLAANTGGRLRKGAPE